MTYVVDVAREDGDWLAEVRGLPGGHTFARTLARLDTYVREAIVLAADLPDEAIPSLEIEYSYDRPELQEAAAIGQRKQLVDREHERLTEEAAMIARRLAAREYSTRDIAQILHLSPGRISQITSAA